MSKKKIFLWSPTNGKKPFTPENAQSILKAQAARPLNRRTWFEYDSQDSKDNKTKESNAADDSGNKGYSKKR